MATNNSLRGQRVAMVTFSLYPADARPRRAANALLRAGMHVDFICLRDEHSPPRETVGTMNILRLPVAHHRGGKFAYIYQYCVFILMVSAILACRSLRSRYDLVYIHNMPDILVVSSLVPKLLGAKVILDQHDPMPELMMTIFNLGEHSRGVRLIRWLEKWSMARANLVVTVNIACKRVFSARSCDIAKIGVVMNSPDEKFFPLHEPRPQERPWNPARSFTIMYHGSIVERNGLDVAVDAVARLRRTIPNAELRIYGLTTPFLQRVMEKVRNQGLNGCVSYLGPRRLEDVAQEIETCDLGIIPNHRNAFTDINTPTRIFEYLTLGKPVIAPRTAGILDYFNKGSLLFFEAGSADDLARQIEYVYFHPDETLKIVKRGQQVYQLHRWLQERETLLTLVSNLLGATKQYEFCEA